MDMSWQTLTLDFQLLNQDRIMFIYKLVEQCLLGSVTFVGGVDNGILAW